MSPLSNPLRRRPNEVILDLTEKCNLKCRMCYFAVTDRLQFAPFDRQLSINGMMPPEVFEAVADDLFPHAHRVALACAAEPLIHPKFAELVAVAGHYRVPDLWFPTNLLALTPKKADAICDASVKTVGISIDGAAAETYESIRVGAKWQRLEKAVELINAARRGTKTQLRIIFTWMKSNREDLRKLPALAERFGASELDVRFMIRTALVDVEDELLEGEDPQVLCAELASVAEDAVSRGLRLASYPEFEPTQRSSLRSVTRRPVFKLRAGLWRWEYVRNRVREATRGCVWPQNTYVVRPNGAVSPCIFWEEDPIALYPGARYEEYRSASPLERIVDGLKSDRPVGTCQTCSERRESLYNRLRFRGTTPARSAPKEQLWSQSSAVADELNRRLTGRSDEGPLHWLKERLDGARVPRAAYLGSERGARELESLGIADHVDVYLREPSAEEGPDVQSIDLERPTLPRGTFDLIVVEQCLASTTRLEALLQTLRAALVSNGRLFVHDYWGPTRPQWIRSDLERLRERLDLKDDDLEVVPAGLPVDHPSAGVRSSELEALLRKGFQWLSEKSYGGNLLAIAPSLPDESRGPDRIRRLLQLEDQLLATGERGHYRVVLARAKTGWAGWLADLRWRLVPKVKRIFVYEPRRIRDLSRRLLGVS